MKHYVEYPFKYDEDLANKVNNGCGPEGWKGKVVPDTIYGINVGEACKIHDYEFELGGTILDFDRANKRFLRNLKHICKHDCTWRSRFLTPLRMIRCNTYYKFVKGGCQYFGKK